MTTTDAASDIVKGVLDLAHAHPIVTSIVLLVTGILAGVAISASILLSNKEIREFVKDLASMRRDQTLVDERDQAVAERQAADAALRSVTADSELAKMACTLAEDTVVRYNAIRFKGSDNEFLQAHLHLLDWIQRIFGFLKSDFNKVTFWYRSSIDSDWLEPLVYSGMAPESARRAKVPIYQITSSSDTFAAMAFRSGEVAVCDDTETDPRYRPLAKPSRQPYRSLIAIPVLVSEAPIGVLTIDSIFVGTFSTKYSQQLGQLSAALLALFFSDRVKGSLNSYIRPEEDARGQ